MPVPLYRLKSELALLGVTQRAFAPRVGVSPMTLNQIANGKIASWPAFRRRCAEALGVSADLLFPADVRDEQATQQREAI
jgi:transcriptional regulator with XRE-family HTH domain